MDQRYSELYQDRINKLSERNWKIEFDTEKLCVKVVNEQGEEIDFQTLELLFTFLQEDITRKNEKVYKAPRKTPIDEFSRKRLDITNYVLLEEEERGNYRTVKEAYESNGIFTLSDFTVDTKENLIHPESQSAIYLNWWEAEKILEPLKEFVEFNKKFSEDYKK
ncbi:hypothetical protein COM71_30875 [Priestia megaterium]|uniref:hypothetical protein n=1 Tax=Priestia megaterium TaxID=1404 RepID=UPI000BED2E7B|nr:hypothetical protein [Priestia megaterium]PEE41564.1 hypothetical protein COM71_30875 [Priestia megaterium]